MNIDDLFRSLSYGEFSNLSLGLEGQGSIEETAQPRIIQHANDGLLRLYSRFILCEKDLLVEMVDGITNYHLDPRFAESNWDPAEVPHPYIKDLGGEPFAGDVIKILAVYDSHGQALPLNDSERPDSLFTPQANLLQVPRVHPFASLGILYQAKHPPLSHETPDQEVALPDVLHEALTAFIGWKVYSFMNTDGATLKAREHQARFEEVCSRVAADDLVSSSTSTTNSRFAKRGWI